MQRGSPVWTKFHITNGSRFPYCLKEIPGQIFRLMRCSIQRVQKGYCYIDLWSIDWWFLSVVPDMLKEFRDNKNGYPADLESEEQWNEIIDKMILLFTEANEETCSKKNPISFETILEHPKNRKIREKWNENETAIDQYRQNCLKEGMKLWYKYFWCLWD